MYVKEILTTKSEMWCRCLSSDLNFVYYELKYCIFVEVDDLWITGKTTQNAKKNIFKKTYKREINCI